MDEEEGSRNPGEVFVAAHIHCRRDRRQTGGRPKTGLWETDSDVLQADFGRV